MAEQFPIVPLQVTARPVSQFTAPQVQPSASGSKLLQLAQALRQITPKVEGIIERRSQAAIEQQRKAAAVFIEQKKFENMAAFKGAVERGEIPQAANPHFRDQATQELARIVAARRVEEIDLAHEQDSTIRESEDLNLVTKFFDDRISDLIQSNDAAELEATIPFLQAKREEFLNRHAAHRLQMRPVERVQSAGREFSVLIGGYKKELFEESDDPLVTSSRQQQLEQLRGDVRSFIANKSMTMNATEVESIVVDQVGKAMVADRNIDLGRTVLDGILSADGKNSLAVVHRTALAQFEERVRQDERQEAAEGWTREQRELQRSFQQAEGLFFNHLDAQIKANPNANLDDIIREASVKWGDLPGPVRQDLESMAAAVRAKRADEQVRRRMEQLAPKLVEGTLTNDETISLAAFLAGRGQIDELQRWDDVAYRRRENGFGTTSSETKMELYKRHADDNLTRDYLFALAESKRISRADFDRWMSVVLQGDESVKEAASLSDVELLREQMILGLVGPDGDRKEMTEEQIARMNSAIAEYQDGVAAHLRENKEPLTTSEKREWRRNFRDRVAESNGGLSWQNYAARQNTPKQPQAPSPQPETVKTIKEVYGDIPDSAFQGIHRESLDTFRWIINTKAKAEVFAPFEAGNHVFPEFNINDDAVSKEARASGTALEKLLAFRKRGPVDTSQPLSGSFPVKLKSLSPEPPSEAELAAQEATLRVGVLKRAAALENAIEVSRPRFETLMAEVKQLQTSGDRPTLRQKSALLEQWTLRRELAMVRARAGYTPAEAKSRFGDEAWRQVPVFGSRVEMLKHGQAVLDFFSIPADSPKAVEFAEAQSVLVKQMRSE